MFDIGFWELLLISVLGLLVLGPERLPRVARSVGLWTGRARAYVRQLSAELDREMQADDLRRSLEAGKQTLQDAQSEIQSVVDASTTAMTDQQDASNGVPVKPSDKS